MKSFDLDRLRTRGFRDAVPGLPRERMRPQDGMWLQDVPENLMIIQSIFSLDRIDLETFRRLWAERVLGAGGGERFPRFTRRVVLARGRLWWQEDPDFDLARHVVLSPEAEEIDSKEKLQDYVGRVASQPLPGDRPLWRIELVPEFVPGVSAIISRVHHCMGDGIALVPVIFSIMDRDDPAVAAFVDPPRVGMGRGGPGKLALGAAASLLGGPILLRKMVARADRSPLHGPELVGEKRVAWTDEIDLALIKEVKNAFGATVNDVIMACVAGAFRRYVDTHTGEVLDRLRVSMPVNIRPPGEPLEMENRFATVLLDLPAHMGDVRRRVEETKRRVDRLKRSVEPLVMFGSQNLLLKTLPAAAGSGLVDFFANKCTCVLTNVPGPTVPLHIGGRRLRGLVFWVPQRAKIGIGVSIFSFSGKLRVGVIGDVALLPEPGNLIAAFDAEFEALRSVLDG